MSYLEPSQSHIKFSQKWTSLLQYDAKMTAFLPPALANSAFPAVCNLKTPPQMEAVITPPACTASQAELLHKAQKEGV